MSDRPRLLDLFSGAGGAARGYQQAGFHVTGVDIHPQPRYAGDVFVQADALAWEDWEFDAVHASPPCQAYTRARNLRGNDHPDLIGPTRGLLDATGLPYVIENVKGAPLHNPVVLEGQMFPELRTHRPRWFETNWPLEVDFLRLAPPRNAKMGRKPKAGEWPQIIGHFPDVPGGRKAMGIDWMTQDELREAIPPAFTELVGHQLMQHVRSRMAA